MYQSVAFELWYWRRLLRVPWTARRSNQSILKEISPEYSLEGLMLKLRLQYFGHLMQRTDWFEKTLTLGKIEGGRRRGQQRMRWLYSISDLMNMSLNKLQEFGNGEGSLVCCSPWGHKESGLTEWLNWTDCSSDFLRKHLSTVFNLSLLWHIQIWCSCIQLKLQVNNWDFNDMKSLEYLFYFNIKQNK